KKTGALGMVGQALRLPERVASGALALQFPDTAPCPRGLPKHAAKSICSRNACTMNNKVLVADDEEDVLNLISSNLKNAGFTVLKATDGVAALAKARNDAPALIVLDLMLPEMSGLEVCKALKSDPATARIPIIMLTAKAEEIDRIVGFELGADDYITKPFSPRELVLRVKSVLRRASDEGLKDAALLKIG